MRLRITLSLAAALMATTALSGHAADLTIDQKIDAWLAGDTLNAATAADIDARCTSALAIATEAKAALEARTGPATMADDYAAYDSLELILGDAGSEIYLVTQSSPGQGGARRRQYLRAQDQRPSTPRCRCRARSMTAWPPFRRQASTGRPPIPLNHQLTEYKLSGVDKDDATRAKVTELQKQITEDRPDVRQQHQCRQGRCRLQAGRTGRPAAGLHRRAQAGRRRDDSFDGRLSRRHPGFHLCLDPRHAQEDDGSLFQPRLSAERGGAQRSFERTLPTGADARLFRLCRRSDRRQDDRHAGARQVLSRRGQHRRQAGRRRRLCRTSGLRQDGGSVDRQAGTL